MDLHVCNPNFKTVREHERQIVIDDDLAAQVMTNEWKRNQGRRKRQSQARLGENGTGLGTVGLADAADRVLDSGQSQGR